ncbi:hypothetical protein [Gulosibacter sp. 10]|uniref:hypothetical protein n=1 Tax=Gulosibacter sp. 10 TaxID=1255570 RepID=UPI00111DA32F|nr:hypothetical protein [Gulosibacter sp. 10]
MRRVRDCERWGPAKTYGSVADFLAARPAAGLNSVEVGGRYLDVLVEDRKSPVTIVAFHSALTKSVKAMPAFSGRQVAAAAGVNLVAVSDPTIEMGDIDLAWFFGNRDTGPLVEVFAPLIKHAARSLRSRRIILFGSSGGGYAAINFGSQFPGAIVLALNPRLDLAGPPLPNFDPYFEIGHGSLDDSSRHVIFDKFISPSMRQKYASGLPFHLCIFQNTGDHYFKKQFEPFVEGLAGDDWLHVRTEYTGKGHGAVPKQVLSEMISGLTRPGAVRDSIRAAGFVTPEGGHAVSAGSRIQRFGHSLKRLFISY